MIAAHGTRFVEVSRGAGRARAGLQARADPDDRSVPRRRDHQPRRRGVHGAGLGARDGRRLGPDKFPLTVQLSANLIRNTDRGTLIAEALPIHKGRTTVVIQSTVKDEQGRLLATVTATQIVPGRYAELGRPCPTPYDPDRRPLIAYFSMEYGLHEEFHSYAGGLGVLAGDFMKSAGDLGLPVGRRRASLGAGLYGAADRAGRLSLRRVGTPPGGRSWRTRGSGCASASGAARWNAVSGAWGAMPSRRSFSWSPRIRATAGSPAGSTTRGPTAASPRRCCSASAACARSRRSTCRSGSTTSTKGTPSSRASS